MTFMNMIRGLRKSRGEVALENVKSRGKTVDELLVLIVVRVLAVVIGTTKT